MSKQLWISVACMSVATLVLLVDVGQFNGQF